MKKQFTMRVAAVMLAAGMALSLAGCRGDDAPEIDVDTPATIDDGGAYLDVDEPDTPKSDGDVGEPAVVAPYVPEDGARTRNEDMYAHMADCLAGDGNIVFSPLSLDIALGMAANAADGDALAALEHYLGTNIDTYNASVAGLMRGLPDSVKIANGVFMDSHDGGEVNADTASVLESVFNAGVDMLDFTDPAAVETINAWCSRNTEGTIPGILEDTNEMDSVLLNALYFRQAWEDEISDGSVWEDTFTAASGDEQTADMMHFSVDGHIMTSEADGFCKYYADGRYCFIGILPRETGDFRLEDLDLRRFVPSAVTDGVTHVTMPEFSLESTLTMNDMLREIGLGAMYEDDALPNLVAGSVQHVDTVLQKAKIDVDRKGTEAAAVTAIVTNDMAMLDEREPYVMEMNRPFAFLLMDAETNDILFMGKVVSVD